MRFWEVELLRDCLYRFEISTKVWISPKKLYGISILWLFSCRFCVELETNVLRCQMVEGYPISYLIAISYVPGIKQEWVYSFECVFLPQIFYDSNGPKLMMIKFGNMFSLWESVRQFNFGEVTCDFHQLLHEISWLAIASPLFAKLTDPEEIKNGCHWK
jgi:hypothetical protein